MKNFEIKLENETLYIETGRMAKQANGSVVVKYGATVVLVAAVMSKEPRENVDFLPLTVEYQERTYAAGKIPGGFFKREGRPSEKEILSARLIDRPIRPLFPKGLINNLQVVVTVLSSDGMYDPDILAVTGASAALSISDIPFLGPIAAVRVASLDGKFIINPTYSETEKSSLNLVIAAGKKGVIMMEGKAEEESKQVVEEAIKFGQPYLEKIINLQDEMSKELKVVKADPELKKNNPELVDKVKELVGDKLAKIDKLSSKKERDDFLFLLKTELSEKLTDDFLDIKEENIKAVLMEVEKEHVRRHILESATRIDGRSCEEIRPITCEVGILPRTHGSGLFTRGQTQSLAVVTLGTAADEQRIDALAGKTSKSFMLHYNFPPFSVGEARPMRGPGRREVGHGALAEKALRPIMPSKEEFPYTVRIVSDILESNGSSSMASVCAGSLALMDAGVPIRESVSGIAIGMVKEEGKISILTDIAGLEDYFGDMDFKVTGTQKGITAIQMDLKIDGIDLDIISKILTQGEKARLKVLDEMKEAISSARDSLSEFAPRIKVLNIPIEKIGEIIGPSGKTIRKIIKETGVSIDIEDDGRVLIASTDSKELANAIKTIELLIEEPEIGKLYRGEVTRIEDFGAFVEILPRKTGLVHVSEASGTYVKNIRDVIKIGDKVLVKVVEIDNLGRLNLSIKKITPDEKNNFKG